MHGAAITLNMKVVLEGEAVATCLTLEINQEPERTLTMNTNTINEAATIQLIKADYYSGVRKSAIEAKYESQLPRSVIRAALKGATTYKDAILSAVYKIKGRKLSIYEHATTVKAGLPEGMITVAYIDVVFSGDRDAWANLSAREQVARVKSVREYAQRKAAKEGLKFFFISRVIANSLTPMKKARRMDSKARQSVYENAQIALMRRMFTDADLGIHPQMDADTIRSLVLDVVKEFHANMIARVSGKPELLAKRKKRGQALMAQAVEYERRKADPAYV